jgi:hypothetical protein
MPLQDWIHKYPGVARLLQGDEELLYSMTEEQDPAPPPPTDEEYRRHIRTAAHDWAALEEEYAASLQALADGVPPCYPHVTEVHGAEVPSLSTDLADAFAFAYLCSAIGADLDLHRAELQIVRCPAPEEVS